MTYLTSISHFIFEVMLSTSLSTLSSLATIKGGAETVPDCVFSATFPVLRYNFLSLNYHIYRVIRSAQYKQEMTFFFQRYVAQAGDSCNVLKVLNLIASIYTPLVTQFNWYSIRCVTMIVTVGIEWHMQL